MRKDVPEVKEVKDGQVAYGPMVLDLKDFRHPGGKHMLLKEGVREKFDSLHHSLNAHRLIVHHCVGRLCSQHYFDYFCVSITDSFEQRYHNYAMAKIDKAKPLYEQIPCLTTYYFLALIRLPDMTVYDLPLYVNPILDLKRKHPFWRNMFLCSLLIAWLFYNSIMRVLNGYIHPLVSVALICFGIFMWTPIEYYFHRWELHSYQNPKTPMNHPQFLKIISAHGIHHAFPNFRTAIVVNFPKILFVSTILLVIFKLTIGDIFGYAFLTGFVFGLTMYDAIHYFIHFGWETRWSYIYNLRKSHLKHHYKDPTRGFGVSTRLWDWVFGTLHLK